LEENYEGCSIPPQPPPKNLLFWRLKMRALGRVKNFKGGIWAFPYLKLPNSTNAIM